MEKGNKNNKPEVATKQNLNLPKMVIPSRNIVPGAVGLSLRKILGADNPIVEAIVANEKAIEDIIFGESKDQEIFALQRRRDELKNIINKDRHTTPNPAKQAPTQNEIIDAEKEYNDVIEELEKLIHRPKPNISLNYQDETLSKALKTVLQNFKAEVLNMVNNKNYEEVLDNLSKALQFSRSKPVCKILQQTKNSINSKAKKFPKDKAHEANIEDKLEG